MPCLRLAFAFAVATLFYPGLAILGFGRVCRLFLAPGLDYPCDHNLVPVGRLATQQRNASPGEREDRANRWVLVAFALIGLLDAYLPAYTDRTGFWTMDGQATRWLRCSVRWRRSAADVAGVCARTSI